MQDDMLVQMDVSGPMRGSMKISAHLLDCAQQAGALRGVPILVVGLRALGSHLEKRNTTQREAGLEAFTVLRF